MAIARPVPAFYCVYFLRSTVRHASVYIGSTPHPVRRLAQHNGVTKGGAVRTSRQSLRPWEMACIVTGFPSHIAALQFEWALQNPHLTLHIPAESRLSYSVARKRNGHPKRPPHSTTSILANLHLLLRVPSFARWPLDVRFYAPDILRAWARTCKTVESPLPPALDIIDETVSVGGDQEGAEEGQAEAGQTVAKTGISSIDVLYQAQRPHLRKAKAIVDFEREGHCTVCHEVLESGTGIHVVCPAGDCEGVSHLKCLSRHFIDAETASTGEARIVPTKGTCPKCAVAIRWIDVVKEVTLRMRGQKIVEKLLRKPRARRNEAAGTTDAKVTSDDEQDLSISDLDEEMAYASDGMDPEQDATQLDLPSPVKKRRGRPPKTTTLTTLAEGTDTDAEKQGTKVRVSQATRKGSGILPTKAEPARQGYDEVAVRTPKKRGRPRKVPAEKSVNEPEAETRRSVSSSLSSLASPDGPIRSPTRVTAGPKRTLQASPRRSQSTRTTRGNRHGHDAAMDLEMDADTSSSFLLPHPSTLCNGTVEASAASPNKGNISGGLTQEVETEITSATSQTVAEAMVEDDTWHTIIPSSSPSSFSESEDVGMDMPLHTGMYTTQKGTSTTGAPAASDTDVRRTSAGGGDPNLTTCNAESTIARSKPSVSRRVGANDAKMSSSSTSTLPLIILDSEESEGSVLA